MKINLGCNDLKLDGFLNIDSDPVVNPDVVADASKLPFDDGSVEEIYAGHLLEHFAHYEDVLREWHRVLKTGGKITVTVPDTEKALALYSAGEISLDLLNQVVFGANDRALQNHHQIFDKEILLLQMNKYFKTEIVNDSPHAFFKVKWQTIAVGIK